MVEVMCDDCRNAFPSNQTVSETERVLVGQTSASRKTRGVNGGTGGMSFSSETYKFVDRTLCYRCVAAREEARRLAAEREEARRRAQARQVLFIVAAAIVALVVFLALPKGQFDSSDSPTSLEDNANSVSSALEGSNDQDAVSSAPTADEIAADELTNDPDFVRANPPREAVTPTIPFPANPAPSPPSPGENDAVDEAIQNALRRGDGVKWRDGKLNGYVVVSASQSYPDRTCRSVIVTTIDRQEQASSPAQTWCLSKDAEVWKPRGN